MESTDQTVFLFKKSLGYANTNTNTGVNVESYISPLNTFAEYIATQSIPQADLSASLVSDASWTTPNTGTRQTSSSFRYIVKYSNLSLTSMSDNPGKAFNYSQNTNLLKNAIPTFKAMIGAVLTTLYAFTLTDKNGNAIPTTNYNFDRDAGIITLYGTNPTVDASNPPKITFWRYEGSFLTQALAIATVSTQRISSQTLMAQNALLFSLSSWSMSTQTIMAQNAHIFSLSTGSISTQTITSQNARLFSLSTVAISSQSIITQNLVTNTLNSQQITSANANITSGFTNKMIFSNAGAWATFGSDATYPSPSSFSMSWGDGTGWYSYFRGSPIRPNNIVTMDDRGRVGINCNSPVEALDVNGSGSFESNVVLGNITNYAMLNSYTNLSLSGGNSQGFLFGAYAKYNDGIHLTYNFLNTNTNAANVIPNAAWGTSRITLGTGQINFGAGAVNSEPTTQMTMTSNGYLGIATEAPSAPLHIFSKKSMTTSGTTGYNWYYNGASGPWANSTSDDISLITVGSIWIAGNRLIVNSDERIKKNIRDIEDNVALEDIRQIQPKIYNYIDKFGRGNQEVYGFIAQQVSTIFPFATSQQKEFVPNVYDMQEVTVGDNLIEFKNTSPNFLSEVKPNQRILFIDDSQRRAIGTISSVTSDSFIATADTTNLSNVSTQLFLYGSEVDDFLALNKDYLFTLNFAATQQIDRILTSTCATITDLQSQVTAQKSTIDALVSRLA